MARGKCAAVGGAVSWRACNGMFQSKTRPIRTARVGWPPGLSRTGAFASFLLEFPRKRNTVMLAIPLVSGRHGRSLTAFRARVVPRAWTLKLFWRDEGEPGAAAPADDVSPKTTASKHEQDSGFGRFFTKERGP
jgi:hypothetical protein